MFRGGSLVEKVAWPEAFRDIHFEMKNSTCPLFRENIGVNCSSKVYEGSFSFGLYVSH